MTLHLLEGELEDIKKQFDESVGAFFEFHPEIQAPVSARPATLVFQQPDIFLVKRYSSTAILGRSVSRSGTVWR